MLHIQARRHTALTLIAVILSFTMTNFVKVAKSATLHLPPVTLRGYGKVSGDFSTLQLPSGRASVLRAQCADVAHAQLLHAKYLSDLGLLPGVAKHTLNVGKSQIAIQEVSGQGSIAALRAGSAVFVLTAPTDTDLRQLIVSDKELMAAPLVAQPETAVPMYLDRWDKFGFRFYYRPWELPKGATDQTYDVTKEFEWAQQQDRTGLVFWDDEYANDTAEGMMNYVWWDWAAQAARQKNLPIAINDSDGAGAATTWLLNRYRSETQQKMPGYVGGFYRVADPYAGGQGTVSWNAQAAEDAQLGLVQSSIRHFASAPNVVSWLEPHGETKHGPHDIFLEYGPVADANYRRYLKLQYGEPGTVSARWFGTVDRLHSWADVHVPELASFLGWGPQAIDLTGQWRVGYEKAVGDKDFTPDDLRHYENSIVPTEPAPEAWFKTDFDDSSWPVVTAPGDDHTMYLPQRPAVYRRSFEVSAAWKEAHPRAWLYEWDLNGGTGDVVRAVVNGAEVDRSTVRFVTPHWNAFEVTAQLRAGTNQLSLRLPKGFLAYRVYLSPEPPRQYPNLGVGLNAQWVDFADFTSWSRVDLVRRGMTMIRQVDPNRQITLMHPDDYADAIKTLAEDYGAEFHNTGYMGAFYADYDPLLMQGSNLPFSLEPGGPAPDLPTFKKMMGLYLSEGTQGVDYFIHIGDVFWNEEIRRYFEANLPVFHLFGKFHAPKAETAALYSNRIQNLTGYPWGNDPNVNLQSGYWRWNIGAHLRDRYPYDGITETDFARGNAGAYKVIVDSNTSIMDEALVREIEQWVRQGGTFITFAQTGRHTPTGLDAWPISRLTGYRVTHIDALDANGNAASRKLKSVPGQAVLTTDWNGVEANGLSLQKVAPECHDLLQWDDGSTAIGYRALGRGYMVQVGCKFAGSGIFDRIEPGGNAGQTQLLTKLYTQLLDWRKIHPTPAQLEPANEAVLMRHWESNNGLYDVWTLWNQNATQTVMTGLKFESELHPATAFEVQTGQPLPISQSDAGAALSGIELQPLQTRVFLTPRRALANAPLEWFGLQRNWWRGTTVPPPHPLPPPPHKISLDLSEGWAFMPLTDSSEVSALALGGSDAGVERMRLGVWSMTHPEIKHALFRRAFSVPPTWNNGRIGVWVQSFFSTTFVDKGRVFLDGKMIYDWNAGGLAGADFSDTLKPGTRHVIAVEAQGAGKLIGPRGSCWLAYLPHPQASVDLSGEWIPRHDALHDEAPIHLPGPWNALMARRSVAVDSKLKRYNAVLNVETQGNIVGVIVNGHLVRRHHHMIGEVWSLNLTPWIRFGDKNEFELIAWGGPTQGSVKALSLDFYDPAIYP